MRFVTGQSCQRLRKPPRRKDHRKRRSLGAGKLGEFEAVGARSKHNVGKNQIHARVIVQPSQGLVRVRRRDHTAAEVSQSVLRDFPQIGIVFDHEYAASDRSVCERLRIACLFGLATTLSHGQRQADRCAFSGHAVDQDVAAGLADETIDHAEAESAALAGFLRREKGLEYPVDSLRIYATPGIAHRQLDERASIRPARQRWAKAGRNGYGSACRHCVTGVDGEIEDCVFQLPGIDENRRQIVRQIGANVDSIPNTIVE